MELINQENMQKDFIKLILKCKYTCKVQTESVAAKIAPNAENNTMRGNNKKKNSMIWKCFCKKITQINLLPR